MQGLSQKTESYHVDLFGDSKEFLECVQCDNGKTSRVNQLIALRVRFEYGILDVLYRYFYRKNFRVCDCNMIISSNNIREANTTSPPISQFNIQSITFCTIKMDFGAAAAMGGGGGGVDFMSW